MSTCGFVSLSQPGQTSASPVGTGPSVVQGVTAGSRTGLPGQSTTLPPTARPEVSLPVHTSILHTSIFSS